MTLINTTIGNHPSHADLANELRDKSVKRIGNNTDLIAKQDGIIAMALHGNEIIRWYPNGCIEVNDANYPTSTTKSRINQYASCRVFSKNGRLFFDEVGGPRPCPSGMWNTAVMGKQE